MKARRGWLKYPLSFGAGGEILEDKNVQLGGLGGKPIWNMEGVLVPCGD